MDIEKLKTILSNVDVINPKRVGLNIFEDEHPFLILAENTNDTIGWFNTNGSAIEEALEQNGLSWGYLFETASNQSPCIYMFIGEDLTKEKLKEILKGTEETLEDGRKFYYEDGTFSAIDVEQYDNSITELEKIATRYASDVFKVYEV